MLVFPLAFKGEPRPNGKMVAIAVAYRMNAFMMCLVSQKCKRSYDGRCWNIARNYFFFLYMSTLVKEANCMVAD